MLAGSWTEARASAGTRLPLVNVWTSVPEREPSRGGSGPGGDFVGTEAKPNPCMASAVVRLTASTWMKSLWMLTNPSSCRVRNNWVATDWTMDELLAPLVAGLALSDLPAFSMTVLTVSTTF